MLPVVSDDMRQVFLPWYTYMLTHGRFQGLDQIYPYSPPYLYLLVIMTYVRSSIPDVAGVKFISIVFDFVVAVTVYGLVKLRYRSGFQPWLAFSIALFLPTVSLTAQPGGQADAIYTSCLVICVYCAVTHRPFRAMLVFSIALAVKFQAIFVIPVLTDPLYQT